MRLAFFWRGGGGALACSSIVYCHSVLPLSHVRRVVCDVVYKQETLVVTCSEPGQILHIHVGSERSGFAQPCYYMIKPI